jgi:hypothetical protein
MSKCNVDVQFEREGTMVIIAMRCPDGRVTMSFPLDTALVFAISAQRISEVDSDDCRLSCTLPRCTLEVEK